MTHGMDATERATTPSGDPIMTAKFLVPAVKAQVVPRPRLFEQLTDGVRGPLTLVSAPAGSGKTVLASAWATSGDAPGPVVWLTLDEEDHDAGVFWSYVLAGLLRAGVDTAGVGEPERLDTVEHSLLVRLAAALSERAAPVVLVLDNAEALTLQQVFDDLDFLLRHSAGHLRLVLVTRVDPNFPLPQYRLDGSVTEIRFPELAFTLDEARQLLAGQEPELSDTAVLAFSYRTRGWAAGLRLVGVDDGHGGQVDDQADYDGSDIAAYFRTEVLDAQPPGVRDVLLSTSVVDVVHPDLAVALTGSRQAASTLRELAQASAFIDAVPGDEEAYACHPLARDLLRARLRHDSPSRMRRLHRKAARWLAESGHTTEAVQQYAAADDWEAAANLLVVDRAFGRLLVSTPATGIAELFTGMPVATAGPAAAVAAAATDVLHGHLEAADKNLRRADELVTRGAAALSDLPLAIAVTAMTRAALAGDSGDALGAAALVQDLQAALPGSPDPDTTALTLFATGRGQFVLGELARAADGFTAAARAASGDRSPGLHRHALAQLALVEAVAGHLTAAVDAASRALGEEDPPEGSPHEPRRGTLGVCAAHVALAWVAVDRGDPVAAGEYVEAASADHDGLADPVCAAALALVRSRLMRSAGDLGGALRVLTHWRERRTEGSPEWLRRRFEVAEALTLLADGCPGAAESQLRRFTTPDAPACLLAHGWVKLATGGAAESWRTARRVSRETALPLELVVEAHLLAAASALALSRPEAAAAGVDEAVRLASAEGLRRPFDEVPLRLEALLRQREQHRSHQPLRETEPPPARLVPRQRHEPSGAPRVGETAPAPLASGVIIQPLTEREREVLVYLDQLLPTEEIAAHMFVSVNTVKTHVRAILRKLAAERRNEAVRRARELGLI
jgi:LuxR family maltose regulon positive regulatory protein